MSKRTALVCLLAALLCAGAGSAAPYRLKSAIGTNLDFVSIWSPQLPFVDLMKSASPWTSAQIARQNTQWDDQQKIDLDENGWVRSLASGQIVRASRGAKQATITLVGSIWCVTRVAER